MAPLQGSQRRSMAPNQQIFELGQQGRKTGITLHDTGMRDEHGLEPIDNIFSSPTKEAPSEDTESEGESGEAAMDLTTASGPFPTLANGQNGNRLPMPRSRSPRKTNLNSPARRSIRMDRSSSMEPGDDDEVPPVKRRLDFNKDTHALPRPGARPKQPSALSRGFNPDEAQDDDDDNGDEETILHGRGASAPDDADESMPVLDVGGYDDNDDDNDDDEIPEPLETGDDEEEQEESVQEPVAAKTAPSKAKGRVGRPSKKQVIEQTEVAAAAADEDENDVENDVENDDEDVVPPTKKRGRPAKTKQPDAAPPSKRRRQENEEEAASDPERQRQEPKAKGGKAAKAKAEAKPAAGRRGRKPKSDEVGDVSEVVIKRGPALPKRSGLVITRNEEPGNMLKTRSGRTSFKPIAFWRNEHVEYEDEALPDQFGKSRFNLQSVKEVYRVDEEDTAPKRPKYRRNKGVAARPNRTFPEEDEEPAESWEEDPGEVLGDIVVWEAEHEHNPPGMDDEVEVVEAQVALASSAIVTKEVRNADFRFAKTLNLPFFGSGMVDLPPGAEKRPKNARRMHMTFVVLSGRVEVTVNETIFRISKGGMWFVPRGNYYGIKNDYDKDARVFFAQGCEIKPDVEEQSG